MFFQDMPMLMVAYTHLQQLLLEVVQCPWTSSGMVWLITELPLKEKGLRLSGGSIHQLGRVRVGVGKERLDIVGVCRERVLV